MCVYVQRMLLVGLSAANTRGNNQTSTQHIYIRTLTDPSYMTFAKCLHILVTRGLQLAGSVVLSFAHSLRVGSLAFCFCHFKRECQLPSPSPRLACTPGQRVLIILAALYCCCWLVGVVLVCALSLRCSCVPAMCTICM